MKLIKRVLIILGVVGLIASGWLVYRANDHPGLGCCSQQMFAADKESTSDLRVTFLGVSTLLFEDGETAILTDGFFTRPENIGFSLPGSSQIMIGLLDSSNALESITSLQLL